MYSNGFVRSGVLKAAVMRSRTQKSYHNEKKTVEADIVIWFFSQCTVMCKDFNSQLCHCDI